MKKIIFLYLSLIGLIGFSQNNNDSIEFTILSETKNIYVQSEYFEGVVFVWEDNDSLHWTLKEDDVIKIEAYIEELYKKGMLNLVYFSNLTYSDLSIYKRQYIGKYYKGTKKKWVWITFLKKDSEELQNNIWKEKPLYMFGGEPVYLSLDFNFEDILNNNFEYE